MRLRDQSEVSDRTVPGTVSYRLEKTGFLVWISYQYFVAEFVAKEIQSSTNFCVGLNVNLFLLRFLHIPVTNTGFREGNRSKMDDS